MKSRRNHYRPQLHTQRTQIADQATQPISESINPGFFATTSPTQEDQMWGRLANGSEEDFYWRRLTDSFYLKDVMPSTYLEMHNLIYEAYHANPLAFAIVEITTSFVLGKGVKVAAKHSQVQAIIDAFWTDPQNHMDERVYQICTELCLYGELFIRYFVNKYDGSVKLRMIDPSLIDLIETDPEDIETPLRFHRRPIGQTIAITDPPANPPDVRQMTNLDRPADTQGDWFKNGSQVQQFAINKVSNAKRGVSDLAVILPWLRRYKDWLTDRVRINKYKTAFLWDITLTGADKKTIDRKRAEYSYPPEPGSVVIHNESESWKAVQPQINANDAKEDGRAVKLMSAMGAQLPEHFLSDGDNGNRATASEMSLPTLLKMERRQRYIKYILSNIIDRVLQEARKAHKIGPRIDTSYEIMMPEIDSGEAQTLANGTNLLTTALATAKAQGWISDETAMRLFFQFTGEEIDIAEEIARVQADQAKQQQQQTQATTTSAQAEQSNQQRQAGRAAPLTSPTHTDRTMNVATGTAPTNGSNGSSSHKGGS